MFQLEKYVELLCWRMYRGNNRDRALDLEDFRQQAQLALLEAQRKYETSKGSWTTFAVTCVKNSLLSFAEKSESYCELPNPEHLGARSPDFFVSDVLDFAERVPLTRKTRKLLVSALNADLLPRCSQQSLRKSVGMTVQEFHVALTELQKKFLVSCQKSITVV
jgi:hypothetical protein